MLDILRKKSSTFGVYFVFAILIVVFAVGFGAVAPDQACGGGPPGSFKNVDLVEVDGKTIDAAEVRMAMQLTGDEADPKRGFVDPDERYRYQSRFVYMNLYGPFSGGLYGVDPEKQSPIKLLKVVDELIETKLVAGYARELGLGVSESQLNDALALLLSNDSFRDPKTGALQVASYRNWVSRSLEATVSGFERLVEDEILRERVIQLLVGEIGVTDAELERSYKLENDKVTIEYVAVDERSAAPLVPVSDEDVAKWLGDNEEKVKAEYERLEPTRYTTPKQWDLRGIKIVAPDPEEAADDEQKKGYEEERKAAKERAEKIRAEVVAALEAKAMPEAPEAPEAPDAPEVPEAPEEGPEGDEPAAFDPVAAFAAIATAQSDDPSKEAGGKLQTVNIKQLGAPPYGPEVAKAAEESLEVGKPSAVLEVASGFWILMPEAIREEKVEAYDEVKTALAKSMLQKERAPEALKALADEVLAAVKKDPTKKLADVVAEVNAAHGVPDKGLRASTMALSRLSRLAAGYPASTPFLMELGGRAPELVSAAFAASAEAPVLDKVFEVGDGKKLVVARFVEATPAEPMTAEAKESLLPQLTLERRRAVYRGWYEDLLAKKRAAGEVKFTEQFEAERRAAENAYIERGGILPGMSAAPPAESEGDTAAP